MECNSSGHIKIAKNTVRIEDHEIAQSDSFRYLGSIINNDGDIEEDVEHMIKTAWLK